MSNARRDGMYLMLLGTVVLILFGTVLSTTSAAELVDFRVLYYPARCLLHHGDPYSEEAVLQVARAEGGERPADIARANHFARYIYPPSTFSFTVPFALMPWWLAHSVWMALTGGGLILSAWLIWIFGMNSSPLLTGSLIGFFLANCELLIVLGNSAGIAIALCVIAVLCFLRNRFVLVGVFCLAISLSFKPHDTGLVWLYFLLIGGTQRRRAIQTLFAATLMSLPGVIWVWHVEPTWVQEMRSNMLAFSVNGGLTDPGFASAGGYGLGMMVNLQTIFSSFWSDPNIYNTAAYLACAPLLLIWVIATIRSCFSPARTWIALAAVVPLTLLPLYHRQYDTKLLLLTVPACAILWAEGGVAGWIALVLNCAGFILTGDFSWIAILSLLNQFLPSASSLTGSILRYVQIFSVPLILLLSGLFYLWIYAQQKDTELHLGVAPSKERA